MSELFQFFVKPHPTKLSKLNPTCPQETLEEKYNFWKKNLAVLIVFRKERKNFGLLAKVFGRVVQFFFDLSVGSLRVVFLKKIRYILSFSHTEQNLFGIQSEVFQQGRQNELSNFLIISGHWAESFRPFVKKIAAGLPKLPSACLQKQFERKNFLKKSLGFFKFFSQIQQNNLASYQFFFDGVVKSVIYVSMGTLGRKIFFKKNLYDFNSFSDYDWKKIQLSGKLFSAGLKKLHFTSL